MKNAIALAALFLLSAPVAQAQAQAPAAKPAARLTLDTPIEVVIADPRGKAVIQKHLARLLSHPDFGNVKKRSLRQIQPFTNGRLSDEKLAAIGRDLAAIK